VVWHQVRNDELTLDVEPRELLRQRLDGGHEAVALLTSAPLDGYIDVVRRDGDCWVRCVATVGLSNALRVGDRPGGLAVGTINIACLLSEPVREEALVEASALVTEAKTAAMVEHRVASRRSGEVATGTGTDCVVVAAPTVDGGVDGGAAAAAYVGKHTQLGSLLGAAVYEAVATGIRRWLARYGDGRSLVGGPREPSAQRSDAALQSVVSLRSTASPRSAAPGLTLIAGGARSGKSRGAVELARQAAREAGGPPGRRPVLVATAQPFDDEMRERIARHRLDRGDTFVVVQEPLALVESVGSHPDTDVVVVDCLTLWLTNALLAGWDEPRVVQELHRLVRQRWPFRLIVVTNEVGLGLVPESALGRQFRDVAGRAHQLLAAAAEQVYLALLGGLVQLRPGPMTWQPAQRLPEPPP
jgi:adenosyl cobinamide kinase/adenosyl cobinamide phosphate guanylyltransferase/adenosylcobinamide amidohydrolase